MENHTSAKRKVEDDRYEYPDALGDPLHQARTTGAVSISAELFEKLYLSPKTNVNGQLRKTFGNPTPIALIGFLLALTPLSCSLMGWQNASSTGAAGIPAYFFCGGLLQIVTGVLEWVLGNTFPSVVFSTFGAFFLTFGGTLNPSFAAFSSFAPGGQPASAGLQTAGFNASFGFFLLWMGVVCFIFLIGSLRTNVCFVIIFLSLVLAFGFLTGAYWLLADDYAGNAALAGKMIVAGGACTFATCMAGWWIFFAIILESVDFPLQLPVGDLSRLIKPRSKPAAASTRNGEV